MISQLDDNGQPRNNSINQTQNFQKSLSSLQGILEGITADTILKDVELQFLHAWLEEQADKIGDLLDVYDSVSSALSDKMISADEKEDIMQLIADCLEYGKIPDNPESKANQFLGFLKGVMADGTLNRIEFEKLVAKLNSDIELQTSFPTRILYNIIRAADSDGRIDDEEYSQIVSSVTKLAGGSFALDGDISGSPIMIFDDEIDFNTKNQCVCFTGKFFSGTRSELESVAKSIGMIPQNSVTRNTKLVVVGSLNSRDWVLSNSGRKIEKASIYRLEGNPIKITTETRWKKFISGNE